MTVALELNLKPQTLHALQNQIGSGDYDFLGYTLNLQNGTITDNLHQPTQTLSEWAIEALSILLTHYAQTSQTMPKERLLKFKDLPGGCAYEETFVKRAIQPIADVFGEKPEELLEATKRLGGTPLNYADVSAEIPALKGISLTYLLWGKEEFPASASILYDQSASNYLPTEDLAVLGELTTSRLIQAKNHS